MIDLAELNNQTIIICHGLYYGCLQDKNNNIIKKGFQTRDAARCWIADKEEYNMRWTE